MTDNYEDERKTLEEIEVPFEVPADIDRDEAVEFKIKKLKKENEELKLSLKLEQNDIHTEVVSRAGKILKEMEEHIATNSPIGYATAQGRMSELMSLYSWIIEKRGKV